MNVVVVANHDDNTLPSITVAQSWNLSDDVTNFSMKTEKQNNNSRRVYFTMEAIRPQQLQTDVDTTSENPRTTMNTSNKASMLHLTQNNSQQQRHRKQDSKAKRVLDNGSLDLEMKVLPLDQCSINGHKKAQQQRQLNVSDENGMLQIRSQYEKQLYELKQQHQHELEQQRTTLLEFVREKVDEACLFIQKSNAKKEKEYRKNIQEIQATHQREKTQLDRDKNTINKLTYEIDKLQNEKISLTAQLNVLRLKDTITKGKTQELEAEVKQLYVSKLDEARAARFRLETMASKLKKESFASFQKK